MEALFETFMIGGIIGGGAYLLLSWLDGDKNSEEDNKGIYTSRALEQKQADEWFDKEKRSFRSMRWINPKTGSVETNDRYRCGFIPHESWYKDNQISRNLVERYMSIREMENFDVVYAHQSRFILEFKKWVKETKPNTENANVVKDVTRTPKSEISLSMLDFFRHHHYREFESKQGIDLKSSELEIIEIFKLYKAWLLLNYNIEVIDNG